VHDDARSEWVKALDLSSKRNLFTKTMLEFRGTAPVGQALRPFQLLVGTIACFALMPSTTALTEADEGSAPDFLKPPISQQVKAAYGRLPLSFEANSGQTDKTVKYFSHSRGESLFLTPIGAVMVLSKPDNTSAKAKSTVLQPDKKQKSFDAPLPAAVGGRMTAHSWVLRMRLKGGNPKAEMVGMAALPGKVNYFKSHEPDKWRTNIATYARVEAKSVYPGIDMVYYGNHSQLEYDFVVAPGAKPQAIRLQFEGANIELDGKGDLVLKTAFGEVRQPKPFIYQELAGKRKEVEGRYLLLGKNEVAFALGAYNRSKAVVIDPVLSYSTYLGGEAGDAGAGITVDGAGNAYVTGFTQSPNFPTTPGVFQLKNRGFPDAFVTKLNSTGSALVYSTYLGGSNNSGGSGIAIDQAGNAYVTGSTSSSDFPTTPRAFQTKLKGAGDAFVTKLNSTGSALLYSTYLGGSSTDYSYSSGIAIDGVGNAYVTGLAGSGFPTTPGAFQRKGSGQFVTKLNATGSKLLYSTLLNNASPGNGNAIAVDNSGNSYVTGSAGSGFPTTRGAFKTKSGGASDAFVTKMNTLGSALVYSTFLGGSGDDYGSGIAVDGLGNAYITGQTTSTDLPTKSAFEPKYVGGTCSNHPGTTYACPNAFVSKLNATGSALVYSTYLGGNGDDEGIAITVDKFGNAYVTGQTSSTNFPTKSAFQTKYRGGTCFEGNGGGFVFPCFEAFVTKLNPVGSALVYSTYLSGSSNTVLGSGDQGFGIAVDHLGNAYVTGSTITNDFPTTTGAFQRTFGGIGRFTGDGFVTKLKRE